MMIEEPEVLEYEVYAVPFGYRGLFRHQLRTIQFVGLRVEWLESRGLFVSYFTVKGEYLVMREAVTRLDRFIAETGRGRGLAGTTAGRPG